LDFFAPPEEAARLAHRHLEDVGDRFALDLGLEHLAAVAPPVAVGAAEIDVGQELHLDVLEAAAGAGRAAAVAGVEAEGARRIAALARHRRLREQLADLVERADVARRVGGGRLADRGRVARPPPVAPAGAAQRAVGAGRPVGLACTLRSAGYSTS